MPNSMPIDTEDSPTAPDPVCAEPQMNDETSPAENQTTDPAELDAPTPQVTDSPESSETQLELSLPVDNPSSPEPTSLPSEEDAGEIQDGSNPSQFPGDSEENVSEIHDAPVVDALENVDANTSTTEVEQEQTSEQTSVHEAPAECNVEPTSEAENEADDVGPRFSDLPLLPEVLKAVADAGYERPTQIQSEIIPPMLYGEDVLAQSQTGSGKTAAFALPILTRIDTEINEPQVLVLVPTRELAIQVSKSFETYGANLPGFQLALIYGGQDYEIQFRKLRKGPHVVVGTPGRVIDHIKRGTLDISGIECLVLDEADEMLNMGFLEDVDFILEHASEERQIALFSATLPAAIRQLSKKYLQDPTQVTVKRKSLTAESIRQRAVFVSPRDRVEVLLRFLEAEDAEGAIVFTRTRETTNQVAEKLSKFGLRALALNGDMPQKQRERTIEKLKSGTLDILVATDIAARGLDVSRISHVFNYDLPDNAEAYTHRIGRTGRAGKKGEAIILLARGQQGRLRFIEKITRQKIEVVDPPEADQINKKRVEKYYARISQAIESDRLPFFEQLVGDFLETSDQPIEKIAAAIAMVGQQGRDFLMKDRPIGQGKPGKERKSRRERGDNARRGKGGYGSSPEPGMKRFRLAIGRVDGVRPGNIVGAVANEADLEGHEIGPIQIHPTWTTIDLPSDRADEILDSLSNTRVSGRAIKIRPYEERQGRGRRNARANKKGNFHSGGFKNGDKPKRVRGGKKGFKKSNSEFQSKKRRNRSD